MQHIHDQVYSIAEPFGIAVAADDSNNTSPAAAGSQTLSIVGPRLRPGADAPVRVVVGHSPAAPSDEDLLLRVHYRGGFEGFLRFHTDEPHRFRGVDDCVLALEWVQKNIERFGGDPTQVTLVASGVDAAVALWLCRRDHYRGAFRRVDLHDPRFPRATLDKRKWLLRGFVGPILPERIAWVQREHPRRLERARRAYRLLYRVPFGPGPHDDQMVSTMIGGL